MEEILNTKYILIPFISAFIGWLTNWVAVKMLFHPKKPINIGVMVLHGIFHRRQRDIAQKLGETIEKKLISHNDIHDVIRSERFLGKINPIIEKYINEFVSERLHTIHPMVAMFPENMVELIRDKLLVEFQNMLPKLMDGAGDALEEHINVKELIRDKIESFDVTELEDILFSILKSEFKMIEYIGGVLGFFIGVTQILIIRFL